MADNAGASETASKDDGTSLSLPKDILVVILEQVDIADVIDYRVVCKNFRNIIDKEVAISHLQNAKLIRCIEPPFKYAEYDWVRDKHKQHAIVDVGFTKLNKDIFDREATAVFSEVKDWQE